MATDSNVQVSKVQTQMQDALNRLDINLIVLWKPDVSKSTHGEVNSNIILIYCEEAEEAWRTFTQEVTEYKLQSVTRPYRILVNSLIEAVRNLFMQKKSSLLIFFLND